ncbi:ATP-binding cassette domain-containing protein [Beggiatoa leptomitoformis]|uniref:ATP-binding cassette domain-containing protein n=1 Tax=Beggiatoa leptomitoformis TaxID=288004 RepID=A0A2N9YIW7_9GAMM|nr:ATP-binding cassette domain-containing protein [Beggiatoa leptomitoformis]AUI70472.1 ATP-binding cassette domain-containing protein [Beggiatoa leptomitoformis]
MVDIQHLTKHFGTFTAVDDISFQVKRGEVLGFLGPNGAGKSTTMKMITGFLTPSAGTVLVAGDDILKKPLAVKRRIGYLPEGAPAYPDMTPLDFLNFIADIRGLKGEKKRNRIDETIARVNLDGVLHQTIDTLSKGFKRRVGLAQAILHDPEVLILDEPTDGLDPNQKHEVRGLIKAMAQEKVIILSTHILEEVDAVCSRAVIIARGKILADGVPEALEAKSRYHNAITLTLQKNQLQADTVRNLLLSIATVKTLEPLAETDSVLSYQLFPKDNQTILADVSHKVREQQWIVEEMHAEKGRLDEVFRQITTVTNQ